MMMTSLQHLYETTVSETLQWLTGKIQWPTDQGHGVMHALVNKMLTAMSDGSVKCMASTHAWILLMGTTSEEVQGKRSSGLNLLQGQTPRPIGDLTNYWSYSKHIQSYWQ